MNVEDELRHEVRANEGGRTLGEAANRWVTWQIVASLIGLGVVLLIVLLFFLPIWNSFFRP